MTRELGRETADNVLRQWRQHEARRAALQASATLSQVRHAMAEHETALQRQQMIAATELVVDEEDLGDATDDE